MKKIASLILALLMLLSVAALSGCMMDPVKNDESIGETDSAENDFGNDPERNELIDKIGGVSDTFRGAVSKETFNSAVEAANAYVADEIAGNSDAVVLDTVSNGELSHEKIDSIGIPEELKAGITSVEEYEVSYSVNSTASSGNGIIALSNGKKETHKVKVYVIKYGVDWKYFSPAPVTGETINKSYYDSVFDLEKYKNCTLSSTSVISIDTQGAVANELLNMSSKVTTTQTLKFADNKVYLEQITESESMGSVVKESIYAYMEAVDGRIVCYGRLGEDAEWVEMDLTAVGFEDIEELTPFYDQYLDYTYFTKTGYGFELKDANAKQYIDEALGELTEIFNNAGIDIDMLAEYYVADGVLSGMRVDAELTMARSESDAVFQMAERISTVVTCTDYGTTVVERPF